MLSQHVSMHGQCLDEQRVITDLPRQLLGSLYAVQRARFSPTQGVKVGLADLDVPPCPRGYWERVLVSLCAG
jgi:hypothetical protein